MTCSSSRGDPAFFKARGQTQPFGDKTRLLEQTQPFWCIDPDFLEQTRPLLVQALHFIEMNPACVKANLIFCGASPTFLEVDTHFLEKTWPLLMQAQPVIGLKPASFWNRRRLYGTDAAFFGDKSG